MTIYSESNSDLLAALHETGEVMVADLVQGFDDAIDLVLHTSGIEVSPLPNH